MLLLLLMLYGVHLIIGGGLGGIRGCVGSLCIRMGLFRLVFRLGCAGFCIGVLR